MSLGQTSPRAAGAGMLAGVASAVALAGAAFVTVDVATCDDPGMYVRTADHIELVGGCADPDRVPESPQHHEEPGPQPVAERSQ